MPEGLITEKVVWIHFRRLRLQKEWVVLPEISSEIFRVSHTPIADFKDKYLKAAIAIGVEDNGKFSPYKPQLLTYSNEPEIIPLEGFPARVGIPRLAIKRLDDSPVHWDVLIEELPETNAQDNLVDEIIKAIMTLFDLDSINSNSGCGDNVQLIPYKRTVECNRNVPILLVPERPKRRALTIKNHGVKDLILGRSAVVDDTTGEITDIGERFEQIPGRKGYDFPSPQGCIYKGNVYVLPKFDGVVEVVEWRKEVIEPSGEAEARGHES